MKRLPIVLSLLALIVVAVSLTHWVLQFYKPEQRPLAAAPNAAAPDPSIDAAATLFGGQAAAVVATNYKLTGVVAAGRDSVAIISANGSPAQALILGKEVAPGVTVSEVHARYVMLSDGGVMKRIDLPVDSKMATSGAPRAPVAGVPAGEPQTSPGMVRPPPDAEPEAGRGDVGTHDEPQPAPDAAAPAAPGPTAQTAPAPPAQTAPAPPAQTAPPPVNLGTAAPATQAAPSPTQPVQMPPPTRSPGSPVSQPPATR